MEMTILYRVQRPNGRGPYDDGAMGFLGSGMRLGQPAPQEDGIKFVGLNDAFAFDTPGALLHWFGHATVLDQLEQLGHAVALIAVPVAAVKYGRNQVAYDRNSVIRVETFSFDKLIDYMVG